MLNNINEKSWDIIVEKTNHLYFADDTVKQTWSSFYMKLQKNNLEL